MSDFVSVDELRERVSAELANAADPRAGEIWTSAHVSIQWGVHSWDGTEGRMTAHRVRLGTDPHALGVLKAHPGVYDDICRAVAAVLAVRPTEKLDDLEVHWSTSLGAGSAYRGETATDARPEDPAELKRAIVAFLQGAQESDAAEWMQWATVELRASRRGVRVVIVGGADERAQGPVRDSIERACRELRVGLPTAAVVFDEG